MSRTRIGILAGLAGLGMWWWGWRTRANRHTMENDRGTTIYKNTPRAADMPGT